jgi:cathepsin B
MSKLSIQDQSLIDSHPSNTHIRSQNADINKAFKKYSQIFPKRNITLPVNFDGKKVWGDSLSPVINQGKCGSCWSIASVNVLADRFNIQSLGKLNIQLSPSKMILCNSINFKHNLDESKLLQDNIEDLENKACYGNTLLNAFEYLYVIGTCTEQCIPYKLSNISKAYELPLCETVSGFKHDMCSDFKYNVFTHKISGTPQRLYRALRFYGIPGTTKDNGSEHNIRYNLYVWGPVATGMKLYSDFYKFDSKNTIYEWDKKSEFISGHAVSIIGWGEDNGKKYWLIRNSWGVNWGIKGYFKIIRGQNECELEENCMSVVPDFFYPHGYISKMISNNNSKNTFVTLKVDKDLEKKRNTFKSDTKILGSGVEQEIGYSRNYIAASPWANLAPPIQLSELPDWGDFIAGKHYPQSNIHTYINTKKVIYTITIALVIYIIISMYK